MLPFGIGLGEVLLVLVVILLVVGPRKLPDMAKTVGKGLRTVRRAGRELRDAVDLDDVRQEVYRPIRQWEQQQRIEDAQLLANEASPQPSAQERNTIPSDAERALDQEPSTDAPPTKVPPADVESPDTEAPDDDAELIVARGPDSMYKKPRLPVLGTPTEDDGPDTP